MTFLLLNQTFWPDVMATSQYLTDVALGLVEQGHEVTVITSRRAYDDPAIRFPERETWRGVRVLRISSTGFGKGAQWKRAADFASFIFLCTIRLVFLPRFDAVLALTSPPLISFLGAFFAGIRRSRFYYWVMDFNPDEAIAAGWLCEASMCARILNGISRFSLRHATKIVALDRFMRDRIVLRGAAPDKVVVLPPWANEDKVKFDPIGRERFRVTHRLEGKFVVMYSGNHSPCHPMDTLLEASRGLRTQTDIVFCFIGGGSEYSKVEALAEADNRENCTSASRGTRILYLPYQPLEELSASLSAADLHVVVMGNPFVGLVHPCKIYNILSVGGPVLYIGPQPGHVPEIFDALVDSAGSIFFSAGHGETCVVRDQILRARSLASVRRCSRNSRLAPRYSRKELLGQFLRIITSGDQATPGAGERRVMRV